MKLKEDGGVVDKDLNVYVVDVRLVDLSFDGWSQYV